MATTTTTVQQPQQVAQNASNEHIILEAQCDKVSVFVTVLIYILVSSIGIITVPMVIIMALLEVKRWRLYFTPAYIYYHELSLATEGMTIHLRDIHEIRAEGEHQIIVKMDRRKYMESQNQPALSCYDIEANSCCSIFKLSDQIDVLIEHVIDAPQFVNAVKMQIAANK